MKISTALWELAGAVRERTKTMVQVIRGGFSQAQISGGTAANWPPADQAALVQRFFHWTAICARVNANAVAAVPLKLYAARAPGQSKARNGRPITGKQLSALHRNPNIVARPVVKAAAEIEEITAHPLLDMLSRVNPFLTGYENTTGTVIFLDVTGNAYWHIAKDGLGVPREIWPLPSHLVSVLPDTSNFIRGYAYGLNPDRRVTFAPDEVIHFKHTNPRSLFYGSGCLEAMVKAHDRYTSADDYEKALLDNRARPDAVINYKNGKIGKDERAAILAQWNALFRGSKKAGGVWVTDQDWDFKTFGFDPSMVAALETRKWTRDEIANAFGVPVSFFDQDAGNRATSQVQLENYGRFTVTPRCRLIEQRLNEDLCPMYDGRLFLAFDSAVPEDEEMELKRWALMVGAGAATPNEVRADQDLPPMVNGDEPLVRAGLVPLSVSIAWAGKGKDPTNADPGAGKDGDMDPIVKMLNALGCSAGGPEKK